MVHLSCEAALRTQPWRAKSRGVEALGRIGLPHFLLDKTYAERPGVEGMKHVMSPPLRDKRNQKALWDALAAGSIDTVGTDHCPFDTSQKLLGKDAFTQIPNGIPGIEERVNLLYTYGVKRGQSRYPSLCGCGQHPGREALRPVPAQRDHRGRAAMPIWWSTIPIIAA